MHLFDFTGGHFEARGRLRVLPLSSSPFLENQNTRVSVPAIRLYLNSYKEKLFRSHLKTRLQKIAISKRFQIVCVFCKIQASWIGGEVTVLYPF